MYKRMNKTTTAIISIIMIVLAVLMVTIFDDCFNNLDKEITDFFAGFFSALGLIGLISVFSKFKKENK